MAPPARPADVAAAARRAVACAPVAGLVAAYLFGSHAEGRAHRESDVDVGVLFDRSVHPDARARFDAGVRLASHISAELRQPFVDVVVLNEAPPGLAARIATTGHALLVADAAAEHAFRRDAQLRAADLAPFLRRMRALKLAALAR